VSYFLDGRVESWFGLLDGRIEIRRLLVKTRQDSTQAVFELSFRNELPQIFGQLPQSGVACNSRALPALPTYGDWDTGLGLNGTRHVLAHNLAHTRWGLMEMMKLLAPAPRQLALDMLSTSMSFLSAMSQWISNGYTENVNAMTMANASAAAVKLAKQECWDLQAVQVREMLRHFHEVRGKANCLGGNRSDEQRAGFYFWATLQAHYVAASWLKTDFKHHSRVAPLLNQHLFEHRVPWAMFDALRESVTQLGDDT
jgi:hypothetical protein